jgi:superfamily II DNA or RNA helicase
LTSCRLIIKDEVNIKFEGLAVETRRKIANKLKFDLPYARHMPSYKLGRWDGTKTYFGIGGTGYLAHLDVILPIVEDAGYEILIEDLRQHSKIEFEPITENYWADQGKTWPKGHPEAGTPIVLRDYQFDVVNKFLANTQALQEVATGAGKTIITAALSDAVSPYGRSIVIVPNKSLVTQTEQDYINMQLDVGVYFGDRKEYNCQHTICTWQSLNNMMKLTAKGEAEITIHEFIQDVVCVIVDEVHMAKADALKTLLTGAMSQIPLRWGLTGTVPKEPFESQALLVSLGPVVSRLSASTLQDAGVLAQCHVNIVQLVDYVEYKDYQSELKYLLEESGRLDTMAELIRKVNETGNTLVLVDRTECGRQLVERLGEKAVFVSGATKGTKRQEEYDEVADATDKIIVATYGVAAVGINIPRIFNLVLIEPGKSFVRVIQSIGRGIRKAEDKGHLTKRKQFYREAKYNFTQEKLEWMKIN